MGSNNISMNLRRLRGDLTQLRHEYRELTSESAAQEEQAKYELTASARHFSRKAKTVVDDKLSFSATLMRAGEVDAANRLLEEVHADVRTEEAALIEKMNEVKVARATKRERMTRVRMARMLAVSMLGALVMGFSALGMAAASFVQDREQDQVRQSSAAQRRALQGGKGVDPKTARELGDLDRKVRKLLLAADLPVTALSAADVRRIGDLTQGDVDLGALEDFLVSVLPSPDLARQVASRIAGSVRGLAAPVAAPVEKATETVTPVKKKVHRVERPSSGTSDEPEPEPSPSPAPEESPSPPEETDKNGGKQETGGEDDGSGRSGGGGNLSGEQGLPLDGV